MRILEGRYHFAYYVQKQQKNLQGNPLPLNLYAPDNEASIMPKITVGAINTTPAEYAAYIAAAGGGGGGGEPSPTAPAAPTGLAATAGDSQLSISFTPGSDGGAAITNYQYSTDDGATYTAFSPAQTSSPVVITGLTNGTTYQVRLKAVNSVGAGTASAAAAGTPVTVPGAPTSVSASAGNTEATVTFTAPADNGGATITSYTVTSSPGGITASGSSSPITITGLTNGVAYTFTVVATNSVGNSVASSASSAVTPAAPTPGKVSFVASFFDNANSGYNTLYNTLSKICTDSARNVIAACYGRTGTFAINKPDTDGITQIETLTETFEGSASFTAGPNTYYTNNIFITKYSSSGVPQWVSQIASDTNYSNIIYDVATDSANNVYALVAHGALGGASTIVTYYNADGSVFGTLTNVFGFGSSIPARYSLIKYNSAGQIQYINTITAGDTNNLYVLITGGALAIDGDDNPYVSCQVQRAGGGSGATSIKFYKYSSVSAGVIQFTLVTADSYAFGGNPAEYHRGMLAKLSSSGDYTWIARMVVPTAWGENNGGTVNKNIVFDSSNNVYICLNSVSSASSPICNIYSGVSAATNPLPALADPYYRIDLRGNSISPALPQYYRFAAIAKFNSSGVFQSLSSAHQLINGSVSLDMNPLIGVDKASNTLFMAVNAQGFTGTNAGSGAQLNKLYIDSFSSNVANGSNYDIFVSNAINVTLAQPQTIMAIIKFNASLAAQSVAYIDTPSGNAGSTVSTDSAGNVYLATTIKDSASAKTIYEFNSLSGSDATFDTFGTITPTNINTDGLIVSYSGDLTNARWATRVETSDSLNDGGFISAVDSANNIYIGGTSVLNNAAGSNTVNIYDYSTVTSGVVQNTLFGSMDATNATDRVGYIIKYQ